MKYNMPKYHKDNLIVNIRRKKMTDKQIMIDGVDVSGCEHLTEIRGCWLSTCDYLKHKGNITSKVCKYNPNCYYKQLKRKEQECEELEDFRTLTREVFTFGDSDVDDENFIKYLQEYSRSYEEAIDGYYRLTDITGIDYTVHGGADIEEIIKRVDILKQECEELKEKLARIEEDLKYQCVDCMNVKSDRYRKALEEIRKIIISEVVTIRPKLYDFEQDSKILDIINKAKGETND